MTSLNAANTRRNLSRSRQTANRLAVPAALAALLCLLAATACVQAMSRPGMTPDASPSPTATPVKPTPTTTPAPATKDPSTPTALPTVTPVNTTPPSTPTPTPLPKPVLVVEGPADGSSIRGSSVVVHGKTTPGSLISINGQGATVDTEGRFQANLTLAFGPNEIRVAAISPEGALTTSVVRVTADIPRPFFLVVSEPEDQTVVNTRNIRVIGRTIREAQVRVKGVAIPVDDQGSFATTITLDTGTNIVEVLSTSPEGQTLRTVVAVIFRP